MGCTVKRECAIFALFFLTIREISQLVYATETEEALFSPSLLMTLLPTIPVGPNTVATMPLKEDRPPVPRLYSARFVWFRRDTMRAPAARTTCCPGKHRNQIDNHPGRKHFKYTCNQFGYNEEAVTTLGPA